MSDNWVRLVPIEPNWTPAPEAVERAREIWASLVSTAEDVVARYEEGVVFYDASGNSETVSCPVCRSELATSWWSNAMDQAYMLNFTNLGIVVPCCGARTSLNDLLYDGPAAFGCFSLEAKNPNLAAIPESGRLAVERALQMSLKAIWQHI